MLKRLVGCVKLLKPTWVEITDVGGPTGAGAEAATVVEVGSGRIG